MQEHHFSLLQRETEKLRNDIEKMRSELRFVFKAVCIYLFFVFSIILSTINLSGQHKCALKQV